MPLEKLDDNSTKPVGVLAAWGRLPIVVAQSLRAEGRRVVCLGVRGHARREDYDALADAFYWIGPSRLGKAIRLFRRHGVLQATMAGKFHKVRLYDPGMWLRYAPDPTGARAFYRSFVTRSADRRDDTLLGRIVEVFAEGGVTMRPATDFAPELLVREGHVAGPAPSAAQRTDIEFGWRLAREMGRLDVGQSVCVKGQAVLAVEAIEGTDLCIGRAGQLCRGGGFTVVKVAKPQQDMRFDVPTVGLRTLRTMREAGGRVLAIEADRTILLDQDAFRREAARMGVTVVALRSAADCLPLAA
ncbi:UDP-2,3-diacylglucosamine diphosphatase LpxI [Botrimarina sp.]|uniref:LpxI family protein n=1 Tax=Botrimarina sp. TaxID=2795802 RepID=UPI0032EF2EEB